jgi:hypothetical protein
VSALRTALWLAKQCRYFDAWRSHLLNLVTVHIPAVECCKLWLQVCHICYEHYVTRCCRSHWMNPVCQRMRTRAVWSWTMRGLSGTPAHHAPVDVCLQWTLATTTGLSSRWGRQQARCLTHRSEGLYCLHYSFTTTGLLWVLLPGLPPYPYALKMEVVGTPKTLIMIEQDHMTAVLLWGSHI